MSITFSEFLSGIAGTTVWGLCAIGSVALTLLVTQFFKFEKPIIKSLTFFSILILLGVLSWQAILNFYKMGNNELNNIPNTRSNIAAINQLRLESTQIKNVPGLTGWIHCGDYDSSKNRWIYKYVSVFGKPSDLKDKEAGLNFFGVDLFDELPSFSKFNLKWNFGKPIASLLVGEMVKILDIENLGKERIWCKIQRI